MSKSCRSHWMHATDFFPASKVRTSELCMNEGECYEYLKTCVTILVSIAVALESSHEQSTFMIFRIFVGCVVAAEQASFMFNTVLRERMYLRFLFNVAVYRTAHRLWMLHICSDIYCACEYTCSIYPLELSGTIALKRAHLAHAKWVLPYIFFSWICQNLSNLFLFQEKFNGETVLHTYIQKHKRYSAIFSKGLSCYVVSIVLFFSYKSFYVSNNVHPKHT